MPNLLHTTNLRTNGNSLQARTLLTVSNFCSRNNNGRSGENCMLPRGTSTAWKRMQREEEEGQHQSRILSVSPNSQEFWSHPLTPHQLFPSSSLTLLPTVQHMTLQELSCREQHLQSTAEHNKIELKTRPKKWLFPICVLHCPHPHRGGYSTVPSVLTSLPHTNNSHTRAMSSGHPSDTWFRLVHGFNR